LTEARNKGFDTVIVDTAGRLHIDDDLMNELQAIKEACGRPICSTSRTR
jgi:signal recognition particle subunit SRP54